MSNRKSRYISMDKRISKLAQIVEEHNIETDDPIQIERYNSYEIALSIIENRPAILKDNKVDLIHSNKIWDDLKDFFHDLVEPIKNMFTYLKWRKRSE
ncbi:hypothetical protein [Bacillus weihaiensis]|uniref:hypothetical protein n=1 Tax=Bacillus weihaiensis TaxID=1547283 RepID=UPI0023543AA3|nr:hypothetical protein [Bacillus weihaiensis]